MQDKSRENNPLEGLADLDRLIDSAIASYSAEEPRPGLAQRVIATAMSAAPSKVWLAVTRQTFGSFALAATSRVGRGSRLGRGFSLRYGGAFALAIVACGSALWTDEHSHRQQFVGRVSEVSQPYVIPARTPTPPRADVSALTAREEAPRSSRSSFRTTHPADSRRRSGNGAVAPRLEVFPTPAPLTAEERALVALATTAPEELKKSLAESTVKNDQPISIAAIHIEPLTPLASASPSNTSSHATP